jgi:hypothetical protein
MSRHHLEQLEGRQMMAFFDGSLVPIGEFQVVTPTPIVVEGTAGPDSIYVSQDASGNLVVHNNGAVSTHAAWQVSKVVINGYSGRDMIYAYPNVSRPIHANGGFDNDSLYGGAAADDLRGGHGIDYIVGNNGNDVLDGGVAGFASFWDNTGRDSVFGMAGDDTLYANEVDECYLHAGDGNDSIYGYERAEKVIAGAGADYIYTAGGNDNISAGSENDIVYAGAGDDVVHGEAGNDWMSGDDGNDKMYAGAGDDVMAGGNGDDVLVSIGGGQYDMIGGNAGYDSFWCDAEVTEKVLDADYWETNNQHIHRVAGFRNYHYSSGTNIAVSRELNGQNLAEPVNGGDFSRNFSTQPLFAPTGPTQDDVDQGNLGDCYFLAPLAAIAKTNPDRIRQSVVELGDRTYAVRFHSGGTEQYVRVDADLPTNSTGGLIYAGLGTGGSLWTAIMEKAWAFYRKNDSNWSSTGWGYHQDSYGSLGASSSSKLDVSWWYKTWNSSTDLWNHIKGQLDAGRAVTISTGEDPAHLVKTHVYSVDSVYIGTDGTRRLVLRNPHGGANPYVDMPVGHLFSNIQDVVSAVV